MLNLRLPARNCAIDFEEHGYIFEEYVGKGQFGQAYKVRYAEDGSVWLAKSIDLMSLDERDKIAALQEAAVMQTLRHPGIVRCRESFVHHDMFLVIIMEYCEQGDLTAFMDRIRKAGCTCPEGTIIRLAAQIAEALYHIHAKNIMHRDIKPSNIFLTDANDFKIGDFGISRLMTNTLVAASTAVGTPQYMAPEMCDSRPYTFKSDMWSLGCVIYELAALRSAFEASSFLALVVNISSKSPSPLPSVYSEDLCKLVFGLLEKDPNARLSADEVLRFSSVRAFRIAAACEATVRKAEEDATEVSPSRTCSPVSEKESEDDVEIRDQSEFPRPFYDTSPSRYFQSRKSFAAPTDKTNAPSDWASQRALRADLYTTVTAAPGGQKPTARRLSLAMLPPSHHQSPITFRPQQYWVVLARVRKGLDANVLALQEAEDGELSTNEWTSVCLGALAGMRPDDALTLQHMRFITEQAGCRVSQQEAEFVLERLTLTSTQARPTIVDFLRVVECSIWSPMYTEVLMSIRELLKVETPVDAAHMSATLREFDTNGTGRLTPAAFRAALHIQHPHLTAAELRDVQHYASKTWDGDILFETFTQDDLELLHFNKRDDDEDEDSESGQQEVEGGEGTQDLDGEVVDLQGSESQSVEEGIRESESMGKKYARALERKCCIPSNLSSPMRTPQSCQSTATHEGSSAIERSRTPLMSAPPSPSPPSSLRGDASKGTSPNTRRGGLHRQQGDTHSGPEVSWSPQLRMYQRGSEEPSYADVGTLWGGPTDRAAVASRSTSLSHQYMSRLLTRGASGVALPSDADAALGAQSPPMPRKRLASDAITSRRRGPDSGWANVRTGMHTKERAVPLFRGTPEKSETEFPGDFSELNDMPKRLARERQHRRQQERPTVTLPESMFRSVPSIFVLDPDEDTSRQPRTKEYDTTRSYINGRADTLPLHFAASPEDAFGIRPESMSEQHYRRHKLLQSQHARASDCRIEVAVAMQHLLHQLQAERGASCRAVAAMRPSGGHKAGESSEGQGRERSLAKLLEHRSRTDEAVASASAAVTCCMHAQRATSYERTLSVMPVTKEDSVFVDLMKDAWSILQSLRTETLASHRLLTDRITRRQRSAGALSGSLSSSSSSSLRSLMSGTAGVAAELHGSALPHRAQSTSSLSADIFRSPFAFRGPQEETLIADEDLGVILASWSLRFLHLTEQLTRGISEVSAWLSSLMNALRGSPRMNFTRVNQLAELISGQLAFIAIRYPEETLRNDWDAARYFMGLVVSRKSGSWQLVRLEEAQSGGGSNTELRTLRRELPELEAQLLRAQSKDDVLLLWKTKAHAWCTRLHVMALMLLRELQVSVKAEMQQTYLSRSVNELQFESLSQHPQEFRGTRPSRLGSGGGPSITPSHSACSASPPVSRRVRRLSMPTEPFQHPQRSPYRNLKSAATFCAATSDAT